MTFHLTGPALRFFATSRSLQPARQVNAVVRRISMITLAPTRLHWIKDDGIDDPSDLCAHSPIHFQIDGNTLVDPTDGDATVSAAAIYLLRTLKCDHTKKSPVGEHLFPCCGHALYDTGDDDVLICGCPNGSDVLVNHNPNGTIILTTTGGESYTVSKTEWRDAVKSFSDMVRQFYDDSLPKTPTETDTDGYARMISEWDRRRNES